VIGGRDRVRLAQGNRKTRPDNVNIAAAALPDPAKFQRDAGRKSQLRPGIMADPKPESVERRVEFPCVQLPAIAKIDMMQPWTRQVAATPVKSMSADMLPCDRRTRVKGRTTVKLGHVGVTRVDHAKDGLGLCHDWPRRHQQGKQSRLFQLSLSKTMPQRWRFGGPSFPDFLPRDARAFFRAMPALSSAMKDFNA
jgi:hypothetical protein